MKKLIAKLIGGVTALAMAIGVGVVVANNRSERADAAYSGASPYSISLVSGTSGASGTVRWEQSSTSLANSPSDGVTWTPSVTWEGTASWSPSNAHVQIGANGKAASAVSLTTSDIPGTIQSVAVMCASYQGKHTVNVSVGGNAYTMDNSNTPTWSSAVDTARTGTGSSSGQIVISFASTSGARALYVKSISVAFTTGGGGDPDPTYTVTYNPNGGSGTLTDPNSPYDPGDTVTVLANTFTYTNHTFNSWNTSPDGSSASYDPDDTFDISDNTILYAQWDTLPTYSVSYHNNDATGGSAPNDNGSYLEGAEVKIKGNDGSLVRTGYEWFGWSLNEDGSGTAYGPAFTDKYTIGTNNVDFYPIWVEAPLLPAYEEELAFHFAGSTVSNGSDYDPRSATVDTQTESKYDSATWQITVGNNSAQLGTNAKVGNLSKSTLGNGDFPAASGLADALGIETTEQKYSAAICTTSMTNIHEVDLFFTETNGGNVTSAWILSSTDGTTWEIEARKVWNIVNESQFKFEINNDARQYAFVAYWNLTNSGGLKGFELKLYGDYPNEQTITASANSAFANETITLTTNANLANWAITTNTAGASLSVDSGKSTVVSATNEGSVTVQATADGFINASKTITFLAVPAGNVYDITFDSDGGSNNPESLRVEEDETFVFPNPGTREHYTFLGWTTDGNTFFGVGETSPAVTSDDDYLAWWEEDAKYSITYVVYENGEGVYEDVDVYGGTYALLPFGSLSGVTADQSYSFKDYTIGGVHKNPGDTFTLDSDVEVVVNFAHIDVLTADGIGVGTSSYSDWSDLEGSSTGAIYAGNSKKSTAGVIQFRASSDEQDPSAVVSTTSGGTVRSVRVTWGSEVTVSRTIDIYGSNTAYSDAGDLYGETPVGTLAGSLTWPGSATSQTYTFESSYKYVGIRVRTGAAYLSSIEIEWALPEAKNTIESTLETRTALSYSYTKNGENDYTYSDVIIKFGGLMNQDLWNDLNDESEIVRYGVLFSNAEHLGATQLKNAAVDGTNVKDYYTNVPSGKANPAAYNDNYIWNLCISITSEQLTREYVGVAYIKTAHHGTVYFDQVTVSASSLAFDLIDSGRYADDAFDGSLQYLALM